MKVVRSKAIFLLLFVALALLAAACGGGDAAESEESGPVAIEVIQNDIYYGDSPDNATNPPVWTVPAGAQVSVLLDNNGALEHNWAIVKQDETVPETYNDETDRDIILLDTGLVDPGESFNDVFVAPAAGEYIVICTVAGHYPSMQGRLVVE